MASFLDPSRAAERDTSARTIVIAIAVVVVLAGMAAFFLRSSPRPQAPPPAYAASLRISDLKMSQAQNFAGGTVTYVDGTISNLGGKTVTNAVVHVTFRDAYGQVAQIEELPIKLLQTSGPYPDTVGLAAAPLAPGESKPFRLIFEHVSEQWNQAAPVLKITGVNLK
jgi:hypothetical protein